MPITSSPTLFVSHAGRDLAIAQGIARSLSLEGLNVIIDAVEVLAGSDFIDFMDQAMRRADYCLLLSSKEAESRYYVALEWHAALAKEAALRRIFLIVGRLEDYPS